MFRAVFQHLNLMSLKISLYGYLVEKKVLVLVVTMVTIILSHLCSCTTGIENESPDQSDTRIQQCCGIKFYNLQCLLCNHYCRTKNWLKAVFVFAKYKGDCVEAPQ